MKTRRCLASLLLTLVMLLNLAPVTALAEGTAPVSAKVHMTLSNEGELAVPYEEVTVTDLNGDGKLTYDEALKALHKAHGKADGYSLSGGFVNKLWGVSTTATMFFLNDSALPNGVTEDTVKAGDNLVAFIMTDTDYWSDYYAVFDAREKTVEEGKPLTLTLQGYMAIAGMTPGYTTALEPLAGGEDGGVFALGYWKDGQYTALPDEVDENGQVTLSFSKAGTYYVTAQGYTEDECPICAPVCVVTVTEPSLGAVRVIVENTTYKKSAGAAWEGTLVDTAVELKSNSNAISVVADALQAKGYTQSGAESGYITEINGLKAFDGGSMSGWMGTLNDWFADEGLNAFTAADGKLQDGDEVRMMYSLSWGGDVGSVWGNNDKTVKALAVTGGNLDPAFASGTHDYALCITTETADVTVTPTAANKNFQVRTYLNGAEVKRGAALTVKDGDKITVKCGDPAWPTMNEAADVAAQTYTLTVTNTDPNVIKSLTVQVDPENPHLADGVIYVKKGDVFRMKAFNQNGIDVTDRVTWKKNTGSTNDIDAATGNVTVANDLYSGGTSYWYYVATADNGVASSSTSIRVAGYLMSAYNKAPSVALSADGQTAKTISATGGVSGHNVWSYEISDGVAAPSAEPTAGSSLRFDAYRPGTFTATYKLDFDETLTDTATLTVTGVAVETDAGTRTKTYLELGEATPAPTVQLAAFCEAGHQVTGWSSADETVATVDESGKVTGVGVGSAIITATDDQGKTGGIKVVVTSAETPYFESIEFLTSAFTTGTWTAGKTFKPTTLTYTLPIRAYSTSQLTLQATTLYDTGKYTATAAYTNASGETAQVEINSGKITYLPNIPFDASTVTVTIADREDAENQTVYTFAVTRPRDTTDTIKTTTGIVMNAVGRDKLVTKYKNYAEGTVLRANAEGTPASGTGSAAATYNYRIYALNGLENFTLDLAGTTVYEHLRYSTDDGVTWTELAQGGGRTARLGFPSGGVTKVTVQILDDKTYSDNVKAGKDGFAAGTPKVYTVWVEQIPASAIPYITSVTTESGDWYPAFRSDLTSYTVVVPNGTATLPMTYTVGDGCTVKLGTAAQTPDENGVYTLTLKTSAQTLNVTDAGGNLTTSYSINLTARSKYAVPDKVVDYLCIGSQYTNGGYGAVPTATLAGSLKSLGNFGGYITYYYEDGLKDDPNNRYGVDFYVYGNSSETNIDSMAELGQVYVSEDGQTWYALAGSEHYENTAIWDYTITYTRQEDGTAAWTDNQGNKIGNAARAWPSAAVYYLNDVPAQNSYTFTGVLFLCQQGSVMGDSTTASYAARARFGYADYYLNGTVGEDVNPYVENPTKSNGFDLAWAVDGQGNPVDVSGKEFHYVKIATASNIWAGGFNEKSTEVTQMVRTTAQDSAVGVTAAPVITVNGQTVALADGQQVYEISTPASCAAVSVSGQEGDNVYINNQWGAARTVDLADEGETLVRVIVQNGEKEPVIYLIKLSRTTVDADEVYRVTGDYLEALGTPDVGAVGGEWMALGLLRSGREVSADYYANAVAYVTAHCDGQERLHASRSTDNSRLILALTAGGYDVTDVAGHDLLQGLNEMAYIRKQGVNGSIWALIAFDSHDYTIPEGDVTREKLVADILDQRLADGGWALTGETSDVDLTAMAIQALSPYYGEDPVVKTAVDEALELLSARQSATGDFGSAESCAQVIVALTALGIDPETDSRFVSNGVSAVDALCLYAVEGGGFRHSATGERNGMSTEQGYYALAAYDRFRQGKTALYDMSDVTVAKSATYSYLEGADSTYTTGNAKGLQVRVDAAFATFVCVMVDGAVVDPANYTVWEGSTYVHFKDAYLATLSAGKHELTVVFTGGSATTNFTVQAAAQTPANGAPTSPKTGDSAGLTLWVAAMSVSALGALALLRKRREVC